MFKRKLSQQRTCDELERDLVLYHYSVCSARRKKSLEMHLAHCATCRSFLEDLHKFLPLTTTVGEQEPGFWDSYLSELRYKLKVLQQRKLRTFRNGGKYG